MRFYVRPQVCQSEVLLCDLYRAANLLSPENCESYWQKQLSSELGDVQGYTRAEQLARINLIKVELLLDKALTTVGPA